MFPILLEPLIASFCQAYPELEISVSEKLVGLAADGFDAGIRLGQFIGADMVAARLTLPFPLVVVGSPDYLARHGRPERVDELRDHACLRTRHSDGSVAPWSFVDRNRTVEMIVSGPLIAHDYPALLGAAIQGVGLAQVPSPVARAPIADGQLRALLTPFAVTTPGVFLYYPERHQVLPKLRVFIEHVKYRSADAPHGRTIARRFRKSAVQTGRDLKVAAGGRSLYRIRQQLFCIAANRIVQVPICHSRWVRVCAAMSVQRPTSDMPSSDGSARREPA